LSSFVSQIKAKSSLETHIFTHRVTWYVIKACSWFIAVLPLDYLYCRWGQVGPRSRVLGSQKDIRIHQHSTLITLPVLNLPIGMNP